MHCICRMHNNIFSIVTKLQVFGNKVLMCQCMTIKFIILFITAWIFQVFYLFIYFFCNDCRTLILLSQVSHSTSFMPFLFGSGQMATWMVLNFIIFYVILSRYLYMCCAAYIQGWCLVKQEHLCAWKILGLTWDSSAASLWQKHTFQPAITLGIATAICFSRISGNFIS